MTLQIEKSNALIAYKKGGSSEKSLLENLFGKEVFNQKITDRIKTFKDVCSEMGKDPQKYLITDEMDEDEKSDIYCDKVRLIFKAFWEGGKADYTNEKQQKWYGWYKCVAGSGFVLDGCDCDFTCSGVGARLSLPDENLYRYVAKQFQSEINDYLSSN